jgi:hypothetical protein
MFIYLLQHGHQVLGCFILWTTSASLNYCLLHHCVGDLEFVSYSPHFFSDLIAFIPKYIYTALIAIVRYKQINSPFDDKFMHMGCRKV